MSCVMICHNYEDESVSSMSHHLANRFLQEGFDVIFVSKSPYFEKEIVQVIGSRTLVLTSWPSKVKNSSYKDFRWFIDLYKKHRPSVIFGHYNGGLISIILAKLLTFGKVKTVEHHHTCSQGYILDRGTLDLKLKIFLFRRAIYYHFFCDHVICPSFYALNDLTKFFKYKSGKVIPHALKDRYQDLRRPSLTGDSQIKLCYLGRLDPGKNVGQLINVIHGHHIKFPKSKIILSVAGFNLDQQKKLIEIQNLPYLKFIGNLKYPEIDSFLQNSDYCIIPSKSDSFNLVAIEALMNNTSLIVSELCGVADFLVDGEDCVKFLPEYENLSKILEDLEYGNGPYSNLNPRKAFFKQFEMDTYLDRVFQFFKTISN